MSGMAANSSTSLPFGDSLTDSSPTVSPMKFTGLEHDTNAEGPTGGQIEVLAQVGGGRLELPASHFWAGMPEPRFDARQEERQPLTLVSKDDLQAGKPIEADGAYVGLNVAKTKARCFRS